MNQPKKETPEAWQSDGSKTTNHQQKEVTVDSILDQTPAAPTLPTAPGTIVDVYGDTARTPSEVERFVRLERVWLSIIDGATWRERDIDARFGWEVVAAPSSVRPCSVAAAALHTIGTPAPPAEWWGSRGHFCWAWSPTMRSQCLGKPNHDGAHVSLAEDWVSNWVECPESQHSQCARARHGGAIA